MKRALAFVFMILALAGCSDSTTEPGNADDHSIENPPVSTQRLDGLWRRTDGIRLSNAGLIHPIYGTLATDLRVSGASVWYDAKGAGLHETFSGTIDGGTLSGTLRAANWSASQGDTFIYPDHKVTFTRIK